MEFLCNCKIAKFHLVLTYSTILHATGVKSNFHTINSLHRAKSPNLNIEIKGEKNLWVSFIQQNGIKKILRVDAAPLNTFTKEIFRSNNPTHVIKNMFAIEANVNKKWPHSFYLTLLPPPSTKTERCCWGPNKNLVAFASKHKTRLMR